MISMNFYGAKNASPNTMCVLPKQVCIYKKQLLFFTIWAQHGALNIF
jgi:hypothetical protein